jgi:hypothetical protein
MKSQRNITKNKEKDLLNDKEKVLKKKRNDKEKEDHIYTSYKIKPH